MQELQLNQVRTAASGADLHGLHRPRQTDSDVLREANRECPPTDSEFNKFHDKILKSIEKNSNAIDKHFDKNNQFEIVDDKSDKKDLSQKLSTDMNKNESKDKSKDKSIEVVGTVIKDRIGSQSKERGIDLEGSLTGSSSGGNRSGITYGDHVLRDNADFSRGGPARESSDGGASRGRQR